MTSKRELFIWKKHHDLILLEEPFKHSNGSKEKGALWSKIADALTQHGMKITQRSVREKFDKLYSDFKQREREEKQASGIDIEYDDNHKALTERVLELEEERQDKETQEKATAAEMRKKATERLSFTKRRRKDDATVISDEPEEEVSPKRRRSQTSMVDMMKESMTMKQKYQEEQGQIRSRELDLRAAELQQQQLQSMLIQQQAMTMAMFSTLNELLKNMKN